MFSPVPVVVAPSGLLVNVQPPEAGKSFRTTLPVATLQVGWVMVPTTGAAGVDGAALTTTEPDAGETQPSLLVTV